MTVTFKDYVSALKNNEVLKPIAKISWLRRETEEPYHEFTAYVLDGNLEISNNNGKRRSCNLVLDNSGKQFLPNEYTFWIRQKFLLEIGLRINGEDFLFPQGVFVLSNPEVISRLSNKTVNIKGEDKFSLLDGTFGGDVDSIYQIPVGSNILSSIKSILEIGEDRKEPILEATTEITPYTIRKEDGSNLGEILIELANMLSRNIYYNELGHLVFEKSKDDKYLGSEWDFTTDEVLYLGATRTYKFSDVRNKIVVIGANINGDIATGIAENRNLSSPTRVQFIGTMVKVIQNDYISTDNLAQQLAEYELDRAIKLQDSINISSIPMYHLDVGKLITITDKSIDLDEGRYIIQNISLPINGKSEMSLQVWKSNE